MIWLRALFFILVVQVVVVGLVPLALAANAPGPRLSLDGLHYLGFVPLALGIAGLLWCNWAFVQRGHGTAAPYDPPRELVIAGLYRYTRNPMYVSALLIVLGLALLTGATSLVAYAVFLAVMYQAFVGLYEEPRLRRTFGDAYARYCAEVPRWFPRS